MPAIQDSRSAQLAGTGFVVANEAVSDDGIEALRVDLGLLESGQSMRQGHVYAARNLLANSSSIQTLVRSASIRALVDPILGPDAIAVRGILFDKVAGANWRVGWHQDTVIPVSERREVPEFTAWSIKQGVPHVRLPASVLESMLTLRIHLDECGPNNGPLRVVPRSHRHGVLTEAQIETIVQRESPVACEAQRGAVLLMRPLLLHASSPAIAPMHRRVIHLEFAADPLPGGLEWPRWGMRRSHPTN